VTVLIRSDCPNANAIFSPRSPRDPLTCSQSEREAQDALLNTAIARADDVNDPPAGVWLVVDHAGRPGLPVGFPDETAIRKTAADRTNRAADVTVGGREYVVHSSHAVTVSCRRSWTCGHHMPTATDC
jgi:hypothetical protein